MANPTAADRHNADMPTSTMHEHFSGIAPDYNELRTTDLEPIRFIKDVVGQRPTLRAIDVACGGGRYSLLLCQHLPGLELTLNDLNESMLSGAARYLRDNGVTNFRTIQADIAHLALPAATLDAVFTFNAIHHFDARLFLEKAARALAVRGHVFVYTRTPSQNAGSVWGRYFPAFAEKENRLSSLADIESWRDASGLLGAPTIHRYRYQRRATLAELLRQVRGRHYSTFSLYAPAELEDALATFEGAIRKDFPDPDRIEWEDENVMVMFRRDATEPR